MTDLEPGTWVRTAAELEPRDFSQEALRTRRTGVLGAVLRAHRSHGLCYAVRHADGTESVYDPDELQDVTGERRTALRVVLVTLRNPLMLMSIPDREDALKLSETYAITAVDLLAVALDRARHT